MDVATLVAKLLPLLDDPRRNAAAILGLLATSRGLADYEVARFLIARRTAAFVADLLSNPDPKVRRTGVRWVELTFARSPAARVLRDATKDPSTTVRHAAFRATRALRLDDVALPDTRGQGRGAKPATPDRWGINPFTKQPMLFKGQPAVRGRTQGWNPTGWRFGLYPPPLRNRRPAPGLSALRTRSDVEALLELDCASLTELLRPGAGRGAPYVAFDVPKATGGVRTLHAPRPRLKRLQRRILDELLAPLEVHPSAHGFVPGRSTVTNARAHVAARIVVKMDLAEFFPTIHFGRVVGLFEQYGAGREASRMLAALVTHRPVLSDGRVAWPSTLPQGAPTSPALSNLVCRRLDARLTALASTVGGTYTRYADDLTFSFRSEPTHGLGRFLWWVNQIVGQEGFRENLKKRRVLRQAGQIRVTGLVTNSGLSVPREARRRFRAILHACERGGVTKETTRHDAPRAFLLGFAGYVAMVQPDVGAGLLAKVRELLVRPRE
jgi:hypothetical protein